MEFDGSLESVVVAADAVLEENPRTSGKQLREALSGLVVNVPTVEGRELVSNEDGSIEFDGSTFVPEDVVSARFATVEEAHARALTEYDKQRAELDRVRTDLSEARAQLVEARKPAGGDVVVSVGSVDVSEALAEVAARLLVKPNVSTTNGKVAKWILTL